MLKKGGARAKISRARASPDKGDEFNYHEKTLLPRREG
jgi:hypothetical protein